MASGGLMVSVHSVCPTTLLLWVLAGATACLLLKGVMRLGGVDSHPPSYPPLPCLPSLPLLGSLLSLMGDQPPHLRFTELGHRYGPLYALYLGPHYTVVVNTYRHAREVLLQRGKEFAGRPKMVNHNTEATHIV
uniref:Uncharacterized protein n=1 Tax=Hucho hucho TaxID=62062 RepID=A0A4W5KFV4_9TELE